MYIKYGIIGLNFKSIWNITYCLWIKVNLQKMFKICLEMVDVNMRRVIILVEKGRVEGWESGF